MLIRFGLGGQLSGSAGGLTAAHNRYGQYVRNRSVPVNPNSLLQQNSRMAFTAASLSWGQALSASQREAWNAYAAETPVLNRLGETVIPTGQAMYMRTNAFRIQLGLTAQLVAPATPGLASLGDITSVTATEADSIALVTVGGTAIGTAICQVGPPLGPGRKFFKGPYTFYNSGVLSATGGSFDDQPTVYGEIFDGQRRPIRIRGQDAEGKLTAPFETIVTVTAL